MPPVGERAELPVQVRPAGARAALAEIYNAEDREHALKAVKTFKADYGVKWPKAVAKITDNVDVLLAFYDFPAEHWIHLRTTNPIESTFATVRLSSASPRDQDRGPLASRWPSSSWSPPRFRWRMVNAPHLVALVGAGATFHKGKLVERPDDSAGEQLVA